MTIDILLATYNGEKYLHEQLDSIIAQTNQDWRLIVRDDGSTDDTMKILKEYEQKMQPGKLVILDGITPEEHKESNIKTDRRILNNFSALMEYTRSDPSAEYSMFCDQDDRWHADKIEKSLEAIKALEKEHGKSTPLLVHSDVRLMDQKGNITSESKNKTFGKRPEKNTLRNELVWSTTQGCTMMMNKPLLSVSLPIPRTSEVGHDHWVGLVAKTTGKYAHLEPTLDYRQHSLSVTQQRHGFVKFVRGKTKRIEEGLDERYRIAATLMEHAGDHMPTETREIVNEFCQIGETPNRATRLIKLLKHGFTPTNEPTLGTIKYGTIMAGGQGTLNGTDKQPAITEQRPSLTR